jgi:hypothetical protein
LNSTTRMALAPEKSTPRRWSMLAVLLLHSCILFGVVILPVVVYEIDRISGHQGITGVEYAGGITYPLYTLYWISKLKSSRARFILTHLTILLTVAFAAQITSTRQTPVGWATLPTIVAAIPMLGMLMPWVRRVQGLAKTCLISTLIALPIGMGLSFFIVLGLAMSAIGPLRY